MNPAKPEQCSRTGERDRPGRSVRRLAEQMGRQIPLTDWCPKAIVAGASARRPRSSSATASIRLGTPKPARRVQLEADCDEVTRWVAVRREFSEGGSAGCGRGGWAGGSGFSTRRMNERTAARKTATITTTAINTIKSPKPMPGLGITNLLELSLTVNEPSLCHPVKST